ncbi:MAG: hypothetical protein FJ265_02065 [Planctomycetes bacterium]|nr:hypothetical protein [Planctomycetota bacterium]
MNCTTCRYELSQCLDGRLPSGRRTIVMQHVDACGGCARFWAELQAAQQLVLQLPRTRVSEGFREQLFERIRAGEGTPEAVFHEPVPALTKVRYALTGAAAAAAVLFAATWLRNDAGRPDAVRPDAGQVVAQHDAGPGGLRPRPDAASVAGDRIAIGGPARSFPQEPSSGMPSPAMFAVAQPLTAAAVAVEAARQFEQRFGSANRHLAQLEGRPAREHDALVGRVLDEANELHAFAEVLLDLRDHDRLSFHDPEVGADLRLTSNLLGKGRLQGRTLDTVRAFVAPALQQSERLGGLTRLIRVRPSFDPFEERAEQEMLRQLNAQRPEVLPKLFFVFPLGGMTGIPFDLRGDFFVTENECGPAIAAPLSRVEEGNQRFQLWIDSASDGRRQMHLQIQIGEPGK